MSKVTTEKFNEIIRIELPSAAESGIYLRNIEAGRAELVLPYNEKSLRPGGTIAGPFMMMLADVCMFAVVLSLLGEIKLAVTTSLNINFLRASPWSKSRFTARKTLLPMPPAPIPSRHKPETGARTSISSRDSTNLSPRHPAGTP